MNGQRQDAFDVTVKVDGTDLGVWSKCDGGAVDSDELTYAPGGMGPKVSLGGHATVAEVTVTALYDLDFFQPLIHWLIGRAGKGQAVINKQPLDADGNAFGRALVYSGILKTVTPPVHDANASAAAEIVLAVTPLGTVA
jgi:hypothetical protein